MTHKVILLESVSMMLHILGILADHIATSQLDATKSQETSDYMISKNIKKNRDYVEIGSKCNTFCIPYTNSQYFSFLDNILKFRY